MFIVVLTDANKDEWVWDLPTDWVTRKRDDHTVEYSEFLQNYAMKLSGRPVVVAHREEF